MSPPSPILPSLSSSPLNGHARRTGQLPNLTGQQGIQARLRFCTHTNRPTMVLKGELHRSTQHQSPGPSTCSRRRRWRRRRVALCAAAPPPPPPPPPAALEIFRLARCNVGTLLKSTQVSYQWSARVLSTCCFQYNARLTHVHVAAVPFLRRMQPRSGTAFFPGYTSHLPPTCPYPLKYVP